MGAKKRIVTAAITVAAAVAITGCDVKTDTPVIGKVMGLNQGEIFKAGDSVCTKEEAQLLLMNLQNQYKRDFGGKVDWQQKMGNTTLEGYLQNKLESEISIVYAMSSLASEQKITLTEAENSLLDAAAEEYYQSLNESEKKFSGASLGNVRTLYQNYYLADKLYEQKTEGIGDTVSDEEARVIKIQYIFIDTQKTEASKAEETLRQIKKQTEDQSQDFLVQANKYSDSDIVECNLKKNQETQDYEKQAFELTEGSVSDVIKQTEGMYLVKCVNSYLKKESVENKEQMIREKKIEAFNKLYLSYIQDCSSDINSDACSKLKLSTDENVKADNLFEVYDQYLSDRTDENSETVEESESGE